jgi:hypothetical protein
VSRCGLFANREIDDGSKLASIYQSGSALAVNVFKKDQPDFLWNSIEKEGGIYVLQYETDCLDEIQKLSIK